MTDDPRKSPRNPADQPILRESRRRARRSFAVGAIAAAAGYSFYRWIDNSRPLDAQPAPLRKMFRANAAIARTLGEEHILSPTYRPEQAEMLRINGVVGLDQDIVLSSWRLQVAGSRNAAQHPRFTRDLTQYEYRYVDPGAPQPTEPDRKSSPTNAGSPPPDPGAAPSLADRFNQMAQKLNRRRERGDDVAGPSDSALYDGTPGLLLTMDDLAQLPRTELVTQFKCIEGWSQIVQWSGFRMRDFIDAYPPAPLPNGKLPRFVYMETPDGFYYNGYDLNACRHPQTTLVTHMGGEPLAQYHGAPLRLHMPIKYGYKQIKRIGLIAYTDQHPDDYWAKLGYDWFGGL